MYLTLLTLKYKPKLTNGPPHSNSKKKYIYIYTHTHRGTHTISTVNTETTAKFGMK